MARAVQVFKENGLENEQLQLTVEHDRRTTEEQRQAQETLLDRAVGEVVGAAAGGDLSSRIHTSQPAGTMARLGERMKDRKSVVEGKSVAGRGDSGGLRIIKKKKIT